MTSISNNQGAIENQNQYNWQYNRGVSQPLESFLSPENKERELETLEKKMVELEKEDNRLEERISDLAVGIGIMEETLENVRKSGEDLESQIEQVKHDIEDDRKRRNSCLWKYGDLCPVVILLIGAVAAAFFPAFSIHILLATTGCFLVTKFIVSKVKNERYGTQPLPAIPERSAT